MNGEVFTGNLSFQGSVKAHGRRHLEIGVIYPLPRDEKRSVYKVDAYFFTPYNLGIDRRRYGVRRFLADLSSYIRFSPASLSFANMTHPNCRLSPLTRIARMLDANPPSAELDAERLVYEIRAFVNTFNGQLRETRRWLVGLARERSDAEEPFLRFATILADIEACLGRFRGLRARFMRPEIPETLRLAITWADESVSLKTEKELYRIYREFSKYPALRAPGETIKPFLAREQDYRRRQNYETVIDPSRPESGENFLYRESMLKKWAQTALYMDFVSDKTIPRLMHVLAGLAAAAAMTFAVLATFLAHRFFTVYSMPWIVVVVVGYIFKDRIKETMRNVLLAFVPRIVADDSRSLIDRRFRRKVGSLRSRVQFLSPRQTPPAVVNLRNASGNPFNALMPPENVIHFHSTVRLNGRALRDNHARLEAIANILRLRLDAWLAGMDDPTEVVHFMQGDRVRRMRARRVYTVHVVLRLAEGTRTGRERLSRYRLVLNRNGVVRIDPSDYE